MGAILCGGQSRRFGSDKAIAEISSGAFLGQVPINALRLAGVDPVVAVGGNFSTELGVPTVADRWPGAGPLAGLTSALLYATQSSVVVTPCDMPLLRHEHITLLTDAATEDRAVVAEVNGKIEPSLGVWPSSWGRNLVAKIRSGKSRLHDVLEIGPYLAVPVPPEAVLDADTPQELITLTKLYQNSSPTGSSEPGQSRTHNRV